MRRMFTFLLVSFMSISSHAIELAGKHILTFYNTYYRYATLTVTAEANIVHITNLFGYGQTVDGTYDASAKTVTIQAGQVVRNDNDKVRYLYTYTTDASGLRTIDKINPIVFNVSEVSDGNTFSTDQNLIYADANYSNTTSFTHVSFTSRINATMTCGIYERETGKLERMEEYPVRMVYIGDGKYSIHNLDEKARMYVYIDEDGNVTSKYPDYPISYSSTYKNYYYPYAYIKSTSGAYTENDKNPVIYGIAESNKLTINTPWNYTLNNLNNTEVEEEYRKKIRYNNEVHEGAIITLHVGRFNKAHSVHKVTQTEVIMTTKENFLYHNDTGWMWSGNSTDDSSVSEVSNKNSKIDPKTDENISKTNYPGLGIKNQGNESKNIYMRVKGMTSLKFYVTSNGSDSRTAVVAITPEGGETTTAEVSSTSDGAMKQIDGLDDSKIYDVEFYTTEKDMTLYAVKLIRNCSENQDDNAEKLIIQSKGGLETIFSISDKPRLYFYENTAEIKTENSEVTFSLDDIESIYYKIDGVTAIGSVKENDTNKPKFNMNENYIVFSKLKANSIITITSVSGTLLKSEKIIKEGKYSLPISNLKTGIYIVSVDGLTYKIMKK